MPPNAFTNFEIQKYYQIEPRFNGVFSRNNLPKKIKDRAYVLNIDQYVAVGTHQDSLFCNGNKFVYYDSFGVGHVTEEIKELLSGIET